MLDLDADGLAPVRSAVTGEVLDGTWTNCQSTYPSGNGQGGTDFQFRFNVLPGDANASGGVYIDDVLLVAQQIGKNTGMPVTIAGVTWTAAERSLATTTPPFELK